MFNILSYHIRILSSGSSFADHNLCLPFFLFVIVIAAAAAASCDDMGFADDLF